MPIKSTLLDIAMEEGVASGVRDGTCGGGLQNVT
jgi:hypothetical protein